MVKITYISHSCFAVELEHSVLVFDYYQGELPLWNPEKTIYVFVSHRHYDHFSKEIFRWTEQYPKIQYILSDDISEASYDASEICRSDLTRIAPNQTETIGKCVIETFRSTDEGVAFLVSCEGKLFYHAGDLNWWHWEGEDPVWNRNMEADFRRYAEPLRGRKIDLAMLPLDPRLGEDGFRGPSTSWSWRISAAFCPCTSGEILTLQINSCHAILLSHPELCTLTESVKSLHLRRKRTHEDRWQ